MGWRVQVQRIVKPLFDFSDHGTDEKHGAILKKDISLLLSSQGGLIYIQAIIDNASIRDAAEVNEWFAEKLIRGRHCDGRYYVGLKNKILVFIAKFGRGAKGRVTRFFYCLQQSRALSDREMISKIYH